MPTEQPQEAEQLRCRDCLVHLTTADGRSRGREIYCDRCYDTAFIRECNDCHDSMDIDDTWIAEDGSGDSVCHSCYQDRQHNDDNDNGVRGRVYSTRNHREMQSSDMGAIITSQRIFSAELECYYPNNDAMRQAETELSPLMGISRDGSLGSRGVEFQTPKLKGKNGEQAIRAACAVLNGLGFTTDRSAGLHVHLDGARILPTKRTTQKPFALINLWSFYLAYEDVLMSFLPPSRRGNRFCSKVSNDFALKEVQNIATLTDAEKMWYRERSMATINNRKGSKYDNSRYLGINLHSLFKDGHVEVRYHSGTVNATKILEWTNLHQTILDLACNGELSYQGANRHVELAEKTLAFYEALRLPERAVKYFSERQALFSNTKKDAMEEVLVSSEAPAVCAV